VKGERCRIKGYVFRIYVLGLRVKVLGFRV
jgi:hypothetical protein